MSNPLLFFFIFCFEFFQYPLYMSTIKYTHDSKNKSRFDAGHFY